MTVVPNIFKHATSELSQDAFIAWLLEWADPQYKTCDATLHNLGTLFLSELLATEHIVFKTITSFKVKTQYHKIDVYLELIIDNLRIGIIVEDKVHTSNHSNQLARYKEIISNKVDKVVPIYFKTGFQHCYDAIINEEYHIYDVKKFSLLLKKGIEQGIKNDIVTSYYDFIALKEQEFDKSKDSFENYKSQPIGKWDWWACTGFFEDHKEQFKAGSGSVGNNRQPLLAFWFGGRHLSIQDEKNGIINLTLYLDVLYSVDQIKINFRVGVNNHHQTNNKNRNKIYNAFRPYLENAGIKHKKPTFRKAKETMLLAQTTDLDNTLKYNELVKFLVKYKTVLDDFIDNHESI